MNHNIANMSGKIDEEMPFSEEGSTRTNKTKMEISKKRWFHQKELFFTKSFCTFYTIALFCSILLSIPNELQSFLEDKDCLDQGKMRTFLVQNSAQVWEQVIESFNPALEVSGSERISVMEDVECLLHLVFWTCMEDNLRDWGSLCKILNIKSIYRVSQSMNTYQLFVTQQSVEFWKQCNA